MKQFKIFMLAGAMLAISPVAAVYAEEAGTEVIESERDAVVISFNSALQMLLDEMLPIQDMDTFIMEMQTQYDDLRQQFRRLERGETRQDNIQELEEALRELEMRMHTIRVSQDATGVQVEQSLGAIFSGSDAFGQHFQSATTGMAAAQGMVSQMTMMETERAILFGQLAALNDDDTFDDMVEDARRNLNELDRQIENLHINQELFEISMEHTLRGILVAVDEINLGISTMEANLELQEINLRRMTVSYEVGIISTHDLRTMEHGLAQAYTQLDSLKRNHDSVIHNLNHLLGLPLAQRTVIEYERRLPDMPSNLDSHIARLIEQDPTVRQAQFDIDRARAERRAYTGNHNDIRISDTERRRAQNAITPETNNLAVSNNELIRVARNRVALQDAVERAIAGREQVERDLEAAIRRAYNDLDALFAQTESHERDLAQAEAALTVAEANFAAGRITRFDVEQARLNVATVEQSVETILNQKWSLAFQLANPSLL